MDAQEGLHASVKVLRVQGLGPRDLARGHADQQKAVAA